MTRYYYFLVALLMSDYQIERCRRQLARSIDAALHKNKAKSLRIRSRTASTGCQGIFSSIHYQTIVCYREMAQNCPILKLPLSLSLHEKTRSILALLNPCPLFSSRISRHVLMPRFICGISHPECRQESNNYIWRQMPGESTSINAKCASKS